MGDLVDEVDVVEALGAVEVALMDRVDAQEAGTAVGAGFAPFADADLGGAGFVVSGAQALVDACAPQVVEMAVGDAGQALEAGIAEHLEGPLAELAGSRSREGAMEGVDLGQEADVGVGVAAREGLLGLAAPVPERAGFPELADQAGHLCPGQPADTLQVTPHQALVGLAEAQIAQAAQFATEPGVEVLAGRGLEAEGLGAFEEGADLLHGLEPLGLDGHDHPPMIPDSDHLQAHLSLESRPRFRLTCHWTRLGVDLQGALA